MKKLTPQIKAAIRKCGFNKAQVKSFIRTLRRWDSPPTDIGTGYGNDYVYAVFGGMYIGFEKDGYAHT